MAKLWERLSHIYGHKFTSTYGESAVVNGELSDVAKTWASGLRGLTGDQIAKGLSAVCRPPDDWPTLPKFRGACEGRSVNEYGLDFVPEYYRVAPIIDQSRLLSSDERDANRAKAKARLAELRAAAFGEKKDA